MVMKYISRDISCTSRTFQTLCAYFVKESAGAIVYSAQDSQFSFDKQSCPRKAACDGGNQK